MKKSLIRYYKGEKQASYLRNICCLINISKKRKKIKLFKKKSYLKFVKAIVGHKT